MCRYSQGTSFTDSQSPPAPAGYLELFEPQVLLTLSNFAKDGGGYATLGFLQRFRVPLPQAFRKLLTLLTRVQAAKDPKP